MLEDMTNQELSAIPIRDAIKLVLTEMPKVANTPERKQKFLSKVGLRPWLLVTYLAAIGKAMHELKMHELKVTDVDRLIEQVLFNVERDGLPE